MTKQKRGFWTFIFSLIPGAGEMYMGFKKQGVSIMTVFWLTVGVSAMLGTGVFLFCLPILWFYSFFNVHNLKSLSEEEFYSVQDNYAFHMDAFVLDKSGFIKRYRNIIALVLIFIGLTVLWNNTIDLLYYIIPSYLMDFVYSFARRLPQFVLGVAIIAIGAAMIRGKKKELEDHEDA
ncbi:hypothetical protein [Konateibacter massiliensis]|uniref:hypothetical protein n=1 Tax=Konateibacter massiliensis TaxID=2002841 RepID=UPI000C14E92B|nr:hypothetical protein [Konateibacter massiliensis]